MSLITALTALCLLLLSPLMATAAENCSDCHLTSLAGAHTELACQSCHEGNAEQYANPSASRTGASGCVECHQGYAGLFDQAMTTRAAERHFVARSYGGVDPQFFEKNCNSCHVSDCLDCHGGDGHRIARPDRSACASCHKGYYVGMDYYGKAPREDSLRYQRGETFAGETFLKMQPDLHSEIGMECADCHSMQSLVAGEKSSKSCRDCHQPDLAVIEHGIAAHLEKMECYACHSAWAPQEYGTFFIRLVDSPASEYFRVRREPGSEYVKSAYLKKQDAPPLGLNASGLVSPIRPQFISYFSDIREGDVVGEENRLLAAEWKAFFPHTVRSGTPMCEGCHGNARRFILEPEQDRIYQLQKDGMSLPSFWGRTGQRVVNGAFMPPERFEAMSSKSAEFTRAYVEKWKTLVENVESSSSQ